jgi:preprotein translocase subunit SecA
VLEAMVARRVPEKAFAEQWELKELAEDVDRVFNLTLPIEAWGQEDGIDETHLRERIQRSVDEMMAAKAANMGPDLMRFIEKSLLIQTLDAVWKEHLYALDHLRQGIGLRAYGQKDPLNEYKTEAFALFNTLLEELKERLTGLLSRVELAPERVMEPPPMVSMIESHADPISPLGADVGVLDAPPPVNVTARPARTTTVDPEDETTWAATPRNAPCPCGSGKKYKHCHGRLS